ncbi:hypothetical protein ACFWGD_10880 [Corynebacterium sp. NPDC060344]|uniref:hypothetical protein n=1 Tax=Corynebacterium sp. NPDC060344 TaxID=3347101 RepID=UPI003663DAD8
MRNNTTRTAAVRRAAIAGAASTALIAGVIAPASAQPAENPAPEAPAASSIENMPQLPGSAAPEVPEVPGVPELPGTPEVPEVPLLNTGERVQVGETQGWGGVLGGGAYQAAFFKQVTVGQEVYPGDPVSVRLQAEGVSGTTHVREIRDIMPSSFELVSVARITVGEDGENPTILQEGEYEVVEREDGLREIRVNFGTNDRNRPTLEAGQTLTVDVVYRAPEEIGTYEHGGYARAVAWGGFGASEPGSHVGAQPIEVKERPIIPEPPIDVPEVPGDESGSIDWGSIDWGSLFGGAGSNNEGDDQPAEEPAEPAE